MNAFCAATVHVFNWLRGITPTFILLEVQHGLTFYQVRIGPIPDVSRVDALTARLGTLGFSDAQVVIP